MCKFVIKKKEEKERGFVPITQHYLPCKQICLAIALQRLLPNKQAAILLREKERRWRECRE